METFERDIPGSNGNSIGKIGFDMDCDGMQDYVRYRRSKIDQVLTYYGIPYIHKNDYKQYLKYRIKSIHYPIVNEYLYHVRKQEGYDASDWDFGKLQDQYNIEVPEKEQTGMDLHVNYDDFLKKEQEHLNSMDKKQNTEQNETILSMQEMMVNMMKEMKELKNQIGNKNVLLSSQEKNDGGNNNNGSESTITSNSGEEDPIQKTGETGQTIQTISSGEESSDRSGNDGLPGTSEGMQGSELSGDLSETGLSVHVIDTTGIDGIGEESNGDGSNGNSGTETDGNIGNKTEDMIDKAQKTI